MKSFEEEQKNKKIERENEVGTLTRKATKITLKSINDHGKLLNLMILWSFEHNFCFQYWCSEFSSSIAFQAWTHVVHSIFLILFDIFCFFLSNDNIFYIVLHIYQKCLSKMFVMNCLEALNDSCYSMTYPNGKKFRNEKYALLLLLL